MDRSNLKSLDAFEIPFIIEKASLFGGKISQPAPHKNKTSVIRRIDVDNYGMMFIQLKDDMTVELERPVSIRLNYRSVSFLLDSKDFVIEGGMIVSHLPREAKAIAVRDNERYVLPFGSEVTSSIYRIEKRGGSIEVNADLIDISRKGLGLKITNVEEDAFLKNDHIWVRSINGIRLSEPIFGSLVYANTRKYRDGTIELKIGVSLNAALPEDVFSELQQLCRLILSA